MMLGRFTPPAPKRSPVCSKGGSLPAKLPCRRVSTPDRGSGWPAGTPPHRVTTPQRQLRTNRRILFPADSPPKGILYMSLDAVKRTHLKSNRLSSMVWIGLRAPWSDDACPLCNMKLCSMLKAYQHFKRIHNARKILCLCKRCGTSFDYVAPAVRHASKCRTRTLPVPDGQLKCDYCSKRFGTNRGLSQHMRCAHPIVYLSNDGSGDLAPGGGKAAVSKAPGGIQGPSLPSLGPLSRDLPTVPVPDLMKASLLASLAWDCAPSADDIEREARSLLSALRKRSPIRKPFCRLKQCAFPYKGSKKFKEYVSLQRAWNTRRNHLISQILDGRIPTCRLGRKEVEEHYKTIWGASGSFRALGGFGDLPGANNEPLMYPISSQEVLSSIKRVKALSSPGPDGVRRVHLLTFDKDGSRLAALYNGWLACGDIPSIFKRSRTTLIPKTSDPEKEKDVRNWRPITLSSLILRVFTRILASRLGDACPPHPRQRGFIKGPGCSENLTVINGLIKTAKRSKSTLSGAFIDMAKAFDTVPHELILASLYRRGLDAHFVKLVNNMYEGVHSRVYTYEGPTSKIGLKLGVKQGDPLSPLLFNLALDPLLFALDQYGRGVRVGGELSVTSLAYADDLVLLSDSWSGMERNLAVLDIFSDMCGMKSNPSKTHAFFLQRAGTKMALNNCEPWALGGSVVNMIPPAGSVKYLGVEISPLKGIVTRAPILNLKEMVSRISRARLKPSQKLTLLRQYAIPRVLYVADHAETSVSALVECDRVIKRAVKMWLHLSHHVADGLLYSAGRSGGLGIPKLCCAVPACRLRRLIAICISDDPITNEVAHLVSLTAPCRKLYSLITKMSPPKKLEDICLEMVSSKTLKDREFRRWAALPSQGLGISLFRDDSASNSWLLAPRQARLSESEYIMSLRLRTNTFPVRLNGASVKAGDGTTSCRLCGHERETLGHIISNCPVLRDNRMRAHNTLCLILKKIAERHGWMTWREKRLTLPDGQAGVPDLVLLKNGAAHIIDVAVVYERNPTCLSSVSAAKVQKYMLFADEVNRWLGAVSVSIWGFAVGARGKWPKENNEILHELGLSSQTIRSVARAFSNSSLIGSLKTCRAFKLLARQEDVD